MIFDIFKKNYKYLIIVMILYLFWAMFLPFLFKANVSRIQEFVSDRTGANIELVNPHISTCSIINIKFFADKITIFNRDSSVAFMTNDFKINIQILSMVLKKLQINSIEADKLKSNFIFSDKIYLGDYLLNFDEKFDIRLNRVKINQYDIFLCDKNTAKKIVLNGNNLYYKNTFYNIFVHAKNDLYCGNQKSNVDFDIKVPKRRNIRNSKVNFNISNLNIKIFENVIQLFKSDLIAADGNINLLANDSTFVGNFDNIKFIMSDSAKSIIFPQTLSINSEFALKANKLILNVFEITGNDIKLKANGEINKFLSKKPILDLNIDIQKNKIQTLTKMLPPLVYPTFNIYRLKMYPLYGTANGELRVRGEIPKPCIFGNIHISDVYIIKPILNAPKATININFIKKHSNIDVIIPVSNQEQVYISGDVDNYDEHSVDLKVRSTKKVDLKTTKFVLDRVHLILRFLIGPVPIMNLDGTGNINIRIIGTKKDPHIWGQFNFNDATASFYDIPNFVLKNACGSVNFENQDGTFINRTGTFYNQPIKISGEFNLFGNFDFNVLNKNQTLSSFIDVIKTSKMLESLKNQVSQIKDIKGNADLDLNLTGKIPNINHIVLNENLFTSGNIKFINNSININNIPVQRLNGNIKFKNLNLDIKLNSKFSDSSQIDIIGKIEDNLCDILIKSDKLNIKEVADKYFKNLDDCFISFKSQYKGHADVFDINKLNCNIHIIKNSKPVRNIKFTSGDIDIKNSNLKLKNINGFIKKSPFNIDMTVNHLSEGLKQSKMNGSVNIKYFDLTLLNYLKNTPVIFDNMKNYLQPFEIVNGHTNLNLKIKNNKMNSVMNFNNINCNYYLAQSKNTKSISMPIKLINGEVVLKNNRIFLNKMNFLADNMPVLVYGNIENIFKTPKYNIHINSKLYQEFFDKYVNRNTIYPIKIKGDIILGSLISGYNDKLNAKLDLKLEENSSIYYMGAILGDLENPITINTDMDILKNNVISLNNFQYNKLISSRNYKQNIFPLLTIKGKVTYNKQFYTFDNFTVKTEVPTDARIFNIIFKKPTIKQGQFISDLKINGSSLSPHILGTLNLNGINMPFLNTTIKDLFFDFKDKNVYVKTKGEILANEIMINACAKNKFSNKYEIENANISLKHFDINALLPKLKQLELDTFAQTSQNNTNNDLLEYIVFKDVNIYADSITVKNINAKKLKAQCSFNNKMQLAVNHFDFELEDGKIWGQIRYNLTNNILKLKIYAENIEANTISIALLDIPNQVFGKLTGTAEVSSNIIDEKTSKSTLCGNLLFTVQDGRMPKLGSLEYMLKAANIAKSGITGLTMNGLADLITPLKTGKFSNIDGHIIMKNGITEKAEIHSKSKDLNLFIRGNYNMNTEIADLVILGQLSRKISTIFGTVGNVSLNSLFNTIPGINLSQNGYLINELNKIPGIELSNRAYRKFIVEMFGHINNNSNVRSFKWIN